MTTMGYNITVDTKSTRKTIEVRGVINVKITFFVKLSHATFFGWVFWLFGLALVSLYLVAVCFVLEVICFFSSSVICLESTYRHKNCSNKRVKMLHDDSRIKLLLKE